MRRHTPLERLVLIIVVVVGIFVPTCILAARLVTSDGFTETMSVIEAHNRELERALKETTK